MLTRLKKIINNPAVMKRIVFTLFILFVFKAAAYITVPMLDTSSAAQYIENSDFLAFINTFNGNALQRFSIVALGISPYITASIVTQLLQMDIVPIFKEWSEQGESGKQKMNQATRYIAIVLAFVQALVVVLGFGNSSSGNMLHVDVTIPAWLAYIYVAIVMAAGTAFVLWLADLITRKGAGNGSSMIIVAGILTSFPASIINFWGTNVTNATSSWDKWQFVIVMLAYVLVLTGVIYMQIAVRKVPTQYANRQGKSDSHIPIKLNSAGVIPVIFASTLLSVPLSAFSGKSEWVTQIFSSSKPIGFMVYVLLIFVFSFFYSFLMINPEKISDNLQKQNAFVPGVRPGEETQYYLARLLFKITVIGATYLTILAIIPIIAANVFNLPSIITIGGTSLLIVVGVSVETAKQLETQANDKTYKGFIE